MLDSQFRADFHIHTAFSPDSTGTPEQIIRRCQQRQLNCIAITDHDTIDGALAVSRIAPFQVIIGEEISSASGHIIGLFLTRAVRPGLSVADTIHEIKSQGGIAVAPHPFSRLARGGSLQDALLENIDLFDCIEIRNSNNLLTSDCSKAEAVAKKFKKAMTVGSDSHLPLGLGSAVATLPAFTSATDFLPALQLATFDCRVHSPLYFARLSIQLVRCGVAQRARSWRRAESSLLDRKLSNSVDVPTSR